MCLGPAQYSKFKTPKKNLQAYSSSPSLAALPFPRLFVVFFPTCQVRVVRFYVSCLFSSSSPPSPPPPPPAQPRVQISVGTAGPPPRAPDPSGLCRTSTTTIHAQWALPDLNHDHPRPVFPAGPQPRPFQIAVGTAGPQPRRPVFTAGPQPRVSRSQVVPLPDLNGKNVRKDVECQKICQIECQIECQKICQIKCHEICQIDMPENARRYAR